VQKKHLFSPWLPSFHRHCASFKEGLIRLRLQCGFEGGCPQKMDFNLASSIAGKKGRTVEVAGGPQSPWGEADP
jgi:hypothetical protein